MEVKRRSPRRPCPILVCVRLCVCVCDKLQLLFITILGTDTGVDYRTMANQTAARVLEEVHGHTQAQLLCLVKGRHVCLYLFQIFHVSNLDLSDPSTFTDQASGWRYDINTSIYNNSKNI